MDEGAHVRISGANVCDTEAGTVGRDGWVDEVARKLDVKPVVVAQPAKEIVNRFAAIFLAGLGGTDRAMERWSRLKMYLSSDETEGEAMMEDDIRSGNLLKLEYS